MVLFFYKNREKKGILIVPAILQETNAPASCQNECKNNAGSSGNNNIFHCWSLLSGFWFIHESIIRFCTRFVI